MSLGIREGEVIPYFFPRYSRLFFNNVLLDYPFQKKKFDLVIIIPVLSDLPQVGDALRTIFEFKSSYNSSKSILIIWMTDETSSSKVSTLESFWGYFLSRQDFHSVEDLYLIEIENRCKVNSWGVKLDHIFTMINDVNFSFAFFHTISNKSLSTAFELNLLLENGILNNSDLNLAAYVIPYYKGVMINFWLMPLSYLFGREIRNPVPFDFIFSRETFDYWMTLPPLETNQLSATYLQLIFSIFMSGLRITEFFLGDKEDHISFYSQEAMPELIQTGIHLVERHKKFIKNSTALINTHNHVQYSVPFNIYSVSDIDNILKVYLKDNTFSGKKFDDLIKKYLSKEHYDRIKIFTRKASPKFRKIGSYGDTWDFVFLSILQAYIESQSQSRKKQIFQIFVSLFSIKSKIWAEEIRNMIVETEEKSRNDALRGCPWRGGDAGKHWHIHDLFEKKLSEDYSRMHTLRNNFFK